MALPDPEVEITDVRRSGDEWSVTLTARSFAFAARLSLAEVGARFSDNYVHLLPGEPVTVRIRPEDPEVDVANALTVRTLADVPRK